MKISLYEFLALSDQEQYHITLTKGEFLDIRVEGKRKFLLYAIHRFFVEVEYNDVENKIINKRAFVTGELLNKYVPKSG